MSIAFSLLLISIGIVPILAIFDGLVAQSVVSALAVAALAIVGVSARAADVNLAAQVTRPLKLVAAVPAIWMVIQILPTPFSPMSHSIWINANEALNQQSWGHISVDLGKTIEALTFYLAIISLIVVGVFVAKDRRRAELALWALAASTTLTTIALLFGKLIADKVEFNETLSGVSSLGIILSLTCGVRAVDRYDSRLAEPARPAQNTRTVLAAAVVGLLVCIAGLAVSGTLNLGLIVAFAAVVFGSVQAIRRVGPASWAIGILIATMLAAAAMIVLWRYDAGRSLSPFLQFATAASPDAISLAQRMLLDTGWLGTGAATYAALLPIYQELGGSVTAVPSTASAFAIELGRPLALFTMALAAALIVMLYRGALVRGRDWFFPAAAAGCAIVILGEAFCDASLLNSGVAVVGAAVIGLGLAQSLSRG